LASAIPQLAGVTRRQAREAFAERLTRMTDETLGRYLQDADPEIRRAAVLALAMKETTAHVERMIDMLRDPEPAVGRAAYVALRNLSQQDFGPDLTCSDADRDQAIARWQAWWQKAKR